MIEKEIDIIKILKTLRNIKIFLKSKIMDRIDKLEVKHSSKNVIQIDDSSDEIEMSQADMQTHKMVNLKSRPPRSLGQEQHLSENRSIQIQNISINAT
jgi:hypothetical protein